MKHGLKKFLCNTYSCLLRILFQVKKKRVVFTSFSGKTYSDNPKAISEALHKQMPEAEIVWLFQKPEEELDRIPDYIRTVKFNVWNLYRMLITAHVAVNNFSFPVIPKRQQQFFIQTWHGDKAFKKVLHDSGYHPNRVLAEQKLGFCDLAVAGSNYGERQYRSAFKYPGEILKMGTPRNDRLIQGAEIEKTCVRERLCLEKDTKNLLYAPTLRDSQNNVQKQQIQKMKISATLSFLERRDSCRWQCLLRAHPAAAGLSCTENDDRIIDVTDYEDMADLLLISDMLITDYSSCAGDFALTGRPVVLFQADRQEYIEKDRTFYFDIDKSPYMVAMNQEELEEILEELTAEKAQENCKEILHFYGDAESGHAAEHVAKIIADWIRR